MYTKVDKVWISCPAPCYSQSPEPCAYVHYSFGVSLQQRICLEASRSFAKKKIIAKAIYG